MQQEAGTSGQAQGRSSFGRRLILAATVLAAFPSTALAAATFTAAPTAATVGQVIHLHAVTPCPTPAGAGDWVANVKFGQGTNDEITYQDYLIAHNGNWGGAFTIPSAAMVGVARLQASCYDGQHHVNSQVNYQSITLRIVWPTKTSLNCAPAKVHLNQTTRCDVTVSNVDSRDATTPSGKVTWTTNAPGRFRRRHRCELIQASAGVARCHVTYRPTRFHGGTNRITATYHGDQIHAATAGAVRIGVLH